MESFNDFLTKWQPFFTAVAGAAATLLGLLFVSLSLHREKITAQKNGIWLRIARRSFGDLIYTLFIGLMFLIPNHHPFGLCLPLFIVAGFRINGLVRTLLFPPKGGGENPAGFGGVREYSIQILSVLGLVGAGVQIYNDHLIAIFFLVPVVAMLLYNASLNAWLMLTMEKSAEDKPPA